MSALRYLDTIPFLTCRHSLQDEGLKQLPDGEVEAAQAIPVQPTGLFIPQVHTLLSSWAEHL